MNNFAAMSRCVSGRYALRALSIVAMCGLVALAGCTTTSGTGAGSATPTATTAAAATATTTPDAATATSGPSGYPVLVYFSKHPDSDGAFNAVFAVHRTSPDLNVATYSIKQLIAGPTASEAATGLYTELTSAISGASNCGGPDFQITLNMKGSTPETGTATLKFCRLVSSGGIGTDARISAEINKTLLQFSTIQKVVILTYQGSCFGDESGMNLCLK